MGTQKQKKGLNISTRSFLTAIAVIFVLMVLTYILTFLIPGGEYARLTDASGNTVIDTEAGFSYVEGGIPFWKWIFSPLLVLSSEGSGALIAVIVFLLVIGGVFNSLEKCNLMKYMLDRITSRFGQKRYQLLAVITLFFMALGSFIGSFEECIPLVPRPCICTDHELLHSIGFCQSLSADAADCSGCTGIQDLCPALRCGIRVRRRLLQCILPDKSGSSDRSGSCGCKLWYLGEMELEIPDSESCTYKPAPALWDGNWLLMLDVFQKTLGRALCGLPLFLLFFNILNRHAMRTAVEDHNPLPIF